MRSTSITVRDTACPAIYFDTTSELAAHIKPHIAASVFKGITRGDAGLVERSDALLEQIETIERLADNNPSTVRAVTGGVADVPAYLQGSPVAMRMRRRVESKAPLNICVSCITSSGISADIIQRRGAAVLALLRKLEAAGHPVTLHVTGGMKPNHKTVFLAAKMDSQPIDLARSCYILGDAEFQRQAMFETVCRHVGTTSGHIRWPFGDYDWNTSLTDQQAAYGQLLNCPPEQILIVPPVFLSEGKRFGHDNEAAKWVNERYAQATAVHEVA
ncbi:MAG: hypothetical protein MJH10_11085 [Epibacterium sp.]|nr:hypothetical protein [Epibacterium sp.]NQX74089.1 hypothetical protein [Epibacterium sp.]